MNAHTCRVYKKGINVNNKRVHQYVIPSRVYVYNVNTLGFYFVCYGRRTTVRIGKVPPSVSSSERTGRIKDVNKLVSFL